MNIYIYKLHVQSKPVFNGNLLILNVKIIDDFWHVCWWISHLILKVDKTIL